jgi:hypothetical protein
MDGVKIHLAGRTRIARFGFDQVLMAERLLGGEDVRDVLLYKRSRMNIFRIAAAAFSESGDGKKVSPPQVQKMIEAEPHKLKELGAALDVAYAEHLAETGEMDEDALDLTKKALAEVREAAARRANGDSGTSSSAKPESSDSTPSSSED